jgi:hypothetical protein
MLVHVPAYILVLHYRIHSPVFDGMSGIQADYH